MAEASPAGSGGGARSPGSPGLCVPLRPFPRSASPQTESRMPCARSARDCAWDSFCPCPCLSPPCHPRSQVRRRPENLAWASVPTLLSPVVASTRILRGPSLRPRGRCRWHPPCSAEPGTHVANSPLPQTPRGGGGRWAALRGPKPGRPAAGQALGPRAADPGLPCPSVSPPRAELRPQVRPQLSPISGLSCSPPRARWRS